METWATFLDDLRAELKDTAATPRFSDKQLYLYTKDAIRDYSTWFPQRIDRLELTLANGMAVLPVNYIEDIYVEYPEDTVLEKRLYRPGAKYREGSPKTYYIQGRKLIIPHLVDEKVLLTYLASHSVPASESDASFAISVAESDTELLRTYVLHKCYSQMRSRQSALDRFKPTGSRDDNPLMPETEDLYADYLRMIAQRTNGGVIILYKRGR